LEQQLPKLSSAAVSVTLAETAEEAMQKLESDHYDLVFLDVIMPGIDGYRLCKWIKAKKPTHVVMLTSKKSPFDKVRGTMSGCDSYLTKPPQEERLRAILHERFGARTRGATDPLGTGHLARG
jgi:twitching motility two-component system response regulator PilG